MNEVEFIISVECVTGSYIRKLFWKNVHLTAVPLFCLVLLLRILCTLVVVMAHSLHHRGLGDTAVCIRDAVANMCDALYFLHEAVQRLPEQWAGIDNHLETSSRPTEELWNNIQERLDNAMQERWRCLENRLDGIIKHKVHTLPTEELWNNIQERLDQVMEERWKCLENRLDAIIEQKVQTLLSQRINMSRSEVLSMKMGYAHRGAQSSSNDSEELYSTVTTSRVDEKTGAVRKDKIDARLSALEASVGKALQHMFPRVEALLSRLEQQPSEFSQFPHCIQSYSCPVFPSSSSHSSPTSQSLTCSEQVPIIPVPSSPSLVIHKLDSAKSLILAAKDGKIKEVSALLNQGTDVNVQDNFGNTALYWAAFRGHYEILCLLVQRGADVNCCNNVGWTPLHAAARWGLTPCISLLLDAGANIESKTMDGKTPLHVAANSGREKSVEALLVEGAQMNAKDNEGKTPLDLANSIAVHRLLCS